MQRLPETRTEIWMSFAHPGSGLQNPGLPPPPLSSASRWRCKHRRLSPHSPLPSHCLSIAGRCWPAIPECPSCAGNSPAPCHHTRALFANHLHLDRPAKVASPRMPPRPDSSNTFVRNPRTCPASSVNLAHSKSLLRPDLPAYPRRSRSCPLELSTKPSRKKTTNL